MRRVDLRPGAQQHLQPLPRLLAAGEDDAVLAAARLGAASGTSTPFGIDLVLARAASAAADARACSETAIRWSIALDRGSPRAGVAEPHPAEVAGGVERRDDRAAGERERRDAERRRHRLVQVEHVEALALEHARDPEERARAER